MEGKVNLHADKYRAVTFLNREQLDYLDNLTKDIYFLKGVHIPRSKLIEEIVEGLKDDHLKDKKALEEDLLRRFNEEKIPGQKEKVA